MAARLRSGGNERVREPAACARPGPLPSWTAPHATSCCAVFTCRLACAVPLPTPSPSEDTPTLSEAYTRIRGGVSSLQSRAPAPPPPPPHLMFMWNMAWCQPWSPNTLAAIAVDAGLFSAGNRSSCSFSAWAGGGAGQGRTGWVWAGSSGQGVPS